MFSSHLVVKYELGVYVLGFLNDALKIIKGKLAVLKQNDTKFITIYPIILYLYMFVTYNFYI